ncbi:MAG: hypothetical protein ACRC0L_03505 [Angustibacter sp.]
MTLLELAMLMPTATPVPVPEPGVGKLPPGFDKFTLIMGWAKWIGLGILVLALMFAGVRMALGNRRGEGGEHASSLGWVLGGVLIVSASAALVGALAS